MVFLNPHLIKYQLLPVATTEKRLENNFIDLNLIKLFFVPKSMNLQKKKKDKLALKNSFEQFLNSVLMKYPQLKLLVLKKAVEVQI